MSKTFEPGQRVRVNLYRYKGWVKGTVKEIEKNHALVEIDAEVDAFDHPVFVNFEDLELISG